jgi:hypothetical protein
LETLEKGADIHTIITEGGSPPKQRKYKMNPDIALLASAAAVAALVPFGIQGIQETGKVIASYELPTKQVLQKAYGISDLVWDCVNDELQGKSAEELLLFIEEEASTAGTTEETALAGSIKECVYLDPFGWHGTENEWAIYLLKTEEWK